MSESPNPLIVALDCGQAGTALNLVDRLQPHVSLFKVGLQLFISAGPPIVGQILERGAKVFLDLKLHDIPNTVARAAIEAGRLGVQMLTLHTLGGISMMSHARHQVRDRSRLEGWPAPRLLGVTVLTSMDERELGGVGIQTPPGPAVVRLARQAREAGLDGLVASPRELQALREAGLGSLLFVTPGIRPEGAPADDQARTRTPAQAIAAGADYLVVGRPITKASDPAQAARRIGAEIRRARIDAK
ncbi:MAG: orotidine-5'-phosphate decarboxylase [Acidobacteriota bacterium]